MSQKNRYMVFFSTQDFPSRGSEYTSQTIITAHNIFYRVLRLMLHDTRGEKIRLASVQFYTDNDATIAMSELRDVGPSRTWWRKIVIQPCDAPKRFAADTDTSSSKGKSASTEMSQLRRASNEKPSSLIGKRRYRDGDDNDDAAPGNGFRELSRRSSGRLYTTQRSSSAEIDRMRNNSKGTENAILLHAPSHVSDADKSDNSYDDSSESPTSDIEQSPFIGTVSHSVPIGERTLNETACCPLPRVNFQSGESFFAAAASQECQCRQSNFLFCASRMRALLETLRS